MFEALTQKFIGSTFSELENGQELQFTHTTPKTQYTVFVSRGTSEEQRVLNLKIEQKYGLVQWKSTYSEKSIEQITKKTGHELQFDFFVTLLRKALSQRQLDCYIDILTTEDLEVLKNRKNGNNQGASRKKGDSGISKRYLILTYMTNETKYHFPLSLTPQKLELNQNDLKQVYNKLRVELEAARTAALNDTQKSQSFSISYNNPKAKMNPLQAQKLKEIDQHKSENQILKAKLARLEEQVQKKKANIQIEAAIEKTKLLKENLQTQNLELVDWKNNIQEQEQTHEEMKKQLARLHKKICSLLHTDKEVAAKKKGEQVEKELVGVKRNVKKNATELDKLKKQLEGSKNKVKELQIKAKKLNSQKEVIRKGRRGPYSSAGSVRSYGSYNSYSSAKRSTGGYSNASSSKPRSNYSYNSYGRNMRR